mmetsp:Transcript_49394/g.131050  ORF Transcript_49394/g.131050 Transcript_49394/m.131050 type:complete len:96 (+) Transcript_49394:1142-1429(+)
MELVLKTMLVQMLIGTWPRQVLPNGENTVVGLDWHRATLRQEGKSRNTLIRSGQFCTCCFPRLVLWCANELECVVTHSTSTLLSARFACDRFRRR